MSFQCMEELPALYFPDVNILVIPANYDRFIFGIELDR